MTKIEKAKKYFYNDSNFRSAFTSYYPLHYSTKKTLLTFVNKGLINLTEEEIKEFLKEHKKNDAYINNKKEYPLFKIRLNNIILNNKIIDIFSYENISVLFQKKLKSHIKKEITHFFYEDFYLKKIFRKSTPLSKNTKDFLFELQEKGLIPFSKRKIEYFLYYNCKQKKYLFNCVNIRKRLDLKNSNIKNNEVFLFENNESLFKNKKIAFDEITNEELVYSFKKHEALYNKHKK